MQKYAKLSGGIFIGALLCGVSPIARSTENQITVCVKRNGDVRLLAPGDSCKDNETRYSWSITGPQGPKGDPGPQGPRGLQGPAGPQGPKGDKGDRGATGPAGIQGPAGLQGPKGDKGAAGAKGDTGAAGPQGLKGDTGATGPKGDSGSTGAQGPKGDIGPQGLKGDKGDPGSAGPKGDTGVPGAAGPKGDKGDPGPAGAKGDTGPAGAKGDAGPQGAQGDPGPAGPKGDKGDTGPQGPQGLQGDPGPVGPVNPNAWDIHGNSGLSDASNFLGTLDGQGLVFKTNSAERMRIAPNGGVGIGTPTPNGLFEVFAAPANVALDQQQNNPAYQTGGYYQQWQSFTAGLTGNLKQLDAFVGSTGNSYAITLRIYQGEGTGGTLLSEQQAYGGSVGWTTFTFPNTIPVIAGQVYTYFIQVDASGGSFMFGGTPTNSYSGGHISPLPNLQVQDMAFRTYVSTAPAKAFTVEAGTGHISVGTEGVQPGQAISTDTGAYLSAGGTWTNTSDRNLKHEFSAVDGQSILDRLAGIPIQSWSYKKEDPTVRHIGPTAQDFYQAFQLGADDRHISTIDAGGVSLVAVQRLYELLRAKDEKIDAQQKQIAAQQKRLSDIETRLGMLESSRK